MIVEDEELKIETINDSVNPLLLGSKLLKAPQAALTARNTTAFATADGYLADSNTTRLTNMDTRLLEIETALKNLGLLK